MPELNGRQWLAIGGFSVVAGASLAATAWPDRRDEIVTSMGDAIENLGSPDTTTTTLPEAAAPPPSCINIADVPLDIKIGAVLLPMAEITQLDQLQDTLLRTKVSNFTFITENTDLTDQVGIGGQVVPIAQALNGIIGTVEQAINLDVTFALDEEGDRVQRTRSLSGFEDLPAPRDQGSADEIAAMFGGHGVNLQTLGVNMVFGPVADVGTPGSDIDRLGRSYGNDASKPGAVIQALNAVGITPVAKHFAYGTVTADTHFEAGITAELGVLEQTEIPLLQTLMDQYGLMNVMVSHASMPGLSTPVGGAPKPASLSPEVYGYIRNKMSFDGVIITDAMNMDALEKHMGLDDLGIQVEGVPAALAAGADLAIIDLDATDPVVASVNQWLADGRLPAARLDEAASRNLRINKRVNICDETNNV